MEKELISINADSIDLNSIKDCCFDVDFGGHLLARMEMRNGVLHVTDAVNGFGDPVDVSRVVFRCAKL